MKYKVKTNASIVNAAAVWCDNNLKGKYVWKFDLSDPLDTEYGFLCEYCFELEEDAVTFKIMFSSTN